MVLDLLHGRGISGLAGVLKSAAAQDLAQARRPSVPR